jgi:hypothetical protein
MGLAVHNFHDTHNGVVPAGIGTDGHVTFWTLILPFIEQQAAYNQMESAPNNANDGIGRLLSCVNDQTSVQADNIRDRVPGATAAERIAYLQQLASISMYYCPTRRAARGTLTNGGWGGAWNAMCLRTNTIDRWAYGPSSDYAAVVLMYNSATEATQTSLTANPGINQGIQDYGPTATGNRQNAGWDSFTALEVGPIRASNHLNTTGNVRDNAARTKTWTPRDTFSWWRDGASNQIIIGEKYMLTSDMYTNAYDATWLWSSWTVWFGSFRTFRDTDMALGRANVREGGTAAGNACDNAIRRFAVLIRGYAIF